MVKGEKEEEKMIWVVKMNEVEKEETHLANDEVMCYA